MMAIWSISTVDKKSVEEVESWVKDGVTIRRTTGFRWGKFTIETSDDDPPEGITEENPDGIDMYSYFGENAENGAELDSLDDGWFAEVHYPDSMDDDEQSRLDELWDEDSYSSWEDDGWYNDETECWFYGTLAIERIS
jgi:hypothetical protein